MFRQAALTFRYRRISVHQTTGSFGSLELSLGPHPFPWCVLKRAHLPLISTGPKYLIVPSIWSSQSRLCVTQCSWDLFMSLFFGWGGPWFSSPAYYRPRSNFQAILDHRRVKPQNILATYNGPGFNTFVDKSCTEPPYWKFYFRSRTLGKVDTVWSWKCWSLRNCWCIFKRPCQMSKTLCKNTSWEGRNVFRMQFKLKMKRAYRTTISLAKHFSEFPTGSSPLF